VVRVLPAGIAELRELQTTRRRLLVLGRRIVPVLAYRTLQCNDLAHGYFLSSVASHLGWQAARFRLVLTRRDAGLRSLQPLFLKFSCGKETGQAHDLPHPLSTKTPRSGSPCGLRLQTRS